MDAPLLHIQIDKTTVVPLFRQIYEKIREDILRGRLGPGTRLPATRTLARELGISRNAVMAAYDQLHAEGYTQARAGGIYPGGPGHPLPDVCGAGFIGISPGRGRKGEHRTAGP